LYAFYVSYNLIAPSISLSAEISDLVKAQNKKVTVKADYEDEEDTHTEPLWSPHCFKYNVFCSSACPGLAGDGCKKGAHRCIVCDGDHPAQLDKQCEDALWEEAKDGREYFESWRPVEESDQAKMPMQDERCRAAIVTFISTKNGGHDAQDAAAMAQRGTEVCKHTWVNRGDKMAPAGELVADYSPTYKNREAKPKDKELSDKEAWWPPTGPFYQRSEFLKEELNKNVGQPLCLDGAMLQVSKIHSKTSVYPMRCNTRF
jgi:hypothetical protein